MKKLHALFYLVVCIIVISCRHRDGIDITYSNSDRYYSMKAHFSKSKTRDVEEYMTRKMADSNVSFTTGEIDGTVALDDDATFYMQKSPGVLKIKLDKEQNSEEAYQRIKTMCEGIKAVVTRGEVAR